MRLPNMAAAFYVIMVSLILGILAIIMFPGLDEWFLRWVG